MLKMLAVGGGEVKYIFWLIIILGLFGYEAWSHQVILDNIESIKQPVELNGIVMDESCYNQLKDSNLIQIKILR